MPEQQLETGLILYHGSYCAVEEPDLDKCAKFKDFGRGFCLTSSKIQAENFAKISAAKMLYDDSNKLWWDGPDATAEEFKRETV